MREKDPSLGFYLRKTTSKHVPCRCEERSVEDALIGGETRYSSGSYFKLQYCIFIAIGGAFCAATETWDGGEESVLKLLFVCLFASVNNFSSTHQCQCWARLFYELRAGKI